MFPPSVVSCVNNVFLPTREIYGVCYTAEQLVERSDRIFERRIAAIIERQKAEAQAKAAQLNAQQQKLTGRTSAR